MKRNYIPFIAGMSTMLLLVGLVGASLAAKARNILRYLFFTICETYIYFLYGYISAFI